MMAMHADHHASGTGFWAAISLNELVSVFIAVAMVIAYWIAAIASSRSERMRDWPKLRYLLWTAGVLCALVAVAGPIAQKAHETFTGHMLGHLLLGMIAPLLIVLSAPVTLLLRSLPTRIAKRVAAILNSRPIHFISHPVTAAILNGGGLWILYTTNLFTLMHESILVYGIVHFHVFMAGYVFTASILYIDPVAHRVSYLYRTVVLLFFIASHGILAKFLYNDPPPGVSVQEAEAGGMLMYYGGDVVDVIIVILLFHQWYRAARPTAAIGRPVESGS